jgi:hypothetical protein
MLPHLSRTYTRSNSIVRDTPTIENIYLHAYASIQAATSVSQTTLRPHATPFATRVRYPGSCYGGMRPYQIIPQLRKLQQ